MLLSASLFLIRVPVCFYFRVSVSLSAAWTPLGGGRLVEVLQREGRRTDRRCQPLSQAVDVIRTLQPEVQSQGTDTGSAICSSRDSLKKN